MTKFVSKPIPDNTQVQREFQRVAEAFSTVHDFDVLHAAPAKPRAGMVRYADGTDWNPGYGEGPYYYEATTSSWIPMFDTTTSTGKILGSNFAFGGTTKTVYTSWVDVHNMYYTKVSSTSNILVVSQMSYTSLGSLTANTYVGMSITETTANNTDIPCAYQAISDKWENTTPTTQYEEVYGSLTGMRMFTNLSTGTFNIKVRGKVNSVSGYIEDTLAQTLILEIEDN